MKRIIDTNQCVSGTFRDCQPLAGFDDCLFIQGAGNRYADR